MQNSFQQSDIVTVWDEVATGYDLAEYWGNKVHESWFAMLLSIVGNPAQQALLEVGCGSAFQSLRLAEAGADVSLLDLSPRAIELARRAFIQKGLPLPRCYCCDALRSDLPDGLFDTVWNMGVIEHFSDEGKIRLMSEMLRMTKAGGKTVIMVPNRLCWPFQAAQAYMKLRGTWKYGNEDDMSPGRLRRLCASAGIRQIETYAFDSISGWYWLPFIGDRLKAFLGPTTVEDHLRRSRFGWMAVLIISKTEGNAAGGTGAQSGISSRQ